MTLAKGRLTPKPQITSIRPITRDDLARLRQPRDKTTTIPQRMKDSHHTIARLASTGIEPGQIAALTGYSANRVGQLLASPAMQALVAHYRSKIDDAFLEAQDAYYSLATRNMIAAERHLADHIDSLDAEGELLPVREALAISRDAADRFGYGKKQTNLNINAEFGTELEKAISRSGKTIDGPSPPPERAIRQGRPGPSPPLRAPLPTLRRIA